MVSADFCPLLDWEMTISMSGSVSALVFVLFSIEKEGRWVETSPVFDFLHSRRGIFRLIVRQAVLTWSWLSLRLLCFTHSLNMHTREHMAVT